MYNGVSKGANRETSVPCFDNLVSLFRRWLAPTSFVFLRVTYACNTIAKTPIPLQTPENIILCFTNSIRLQYYCYNEQPGVSAEIFMFYE